MAKLINTWGCYKWFKEDGENLIYKPDLDNFIKHQAKSILFNCIDEDEQYLTLKYKDEIFRVKPDLYKRVPSPQYKYGDAVVLIEKPYVQAIIEDITWHSDRNEPMYFIKIDGKKKSKRYWNCDFKSM